MLLLLPILIPLAGALLAALLPSHGRSRAALGAATPQKVDKVPRSL